MEDAAKAGKDEQVNDTKKRRFRIVDDCGWTHIIETDRPDLMAADIVRLVPHVLSAAEITEKESTHDTERVFAAVP